MTGGYDNGYRCCPCFWGRQPGSLVLSLAKQVADFRGLEVLDAGCGEGKNAAYLSCLGAQVDAVDVSSLAIRNGMAAWPQAKGINWQVVDVRQLTLVREFYHIVLAYGLFHCFLTKGEIEETLIRCQEATQIGGYHVICAFNDRYQELEAHDNFEPCLLGHEVYVSWYRFWKILSATDANLTESHPHNGIKHTHSVTRILAQKVCP